MAVQVGDRAPDFTLKKQDGSDVTLSALLREKAVVLYFYPKDETPGCTAESCSFRDAYDVFRKAGAEVVGVSGDSVESHVGFAANHRLPFVLLSDPGQRVRDLYGVQPGLFGLLAGRMTFVIDREGIVRHAFNSVLNPKKHVAEALEALRKLSPQ